MGDFNAVPESDEIRWLTGLTTLDGRRVAYQDAWDRMHPRDPGYTWARANPYVGELHWLRADRRLDYIFVSPARRDRRGTIRAARIVLDQPRVPAAGGAPVFASDHYGLIADVDVTAAEVEAARATS
jgi:endonuclease/exonuclease/phosphatase family metal-dependent hydrolase